jgi:transcriptional regulator with XRE-family HTH domain
MSTGDEREAARPPAPTGAMGVVPLPRLREVRQARFLSQEALAEKAKVSHFTVRRIEQGSPARYQTIRKLAEALDVDPAELAGASPLTQRMRRVAEPGVRYGPGRRRRSAPEEDTGGGTPKAEAA